MSSELAFSVEHATQYIIRALSTRGSKRAAPARQLRVKDFTLLRFTASRVAGR
jgi:hypothetical protein